MKSLLRAYTFHLLALLVVDAILGASFQVSGGTQTLLIGAGVLAVLNILLKPILKLLFLPINALSLGLFTLVINAGVFYLFTQLVKAVGISPWHFPGFNYNSLIIPTLDVNYWGTLFLASLVVSATVNFCTYLVE